MKLSARLNKLERTGSTAHGFEVWYADHGDPERFTCNGATLTATQLDERSTAARIIRVVYETGRDGA